MDILAIGAIGASRCCQVVTYTLLTRNQRWRTSRSLRSWVNRWGMIHQIRTAKTCVRLVRAILTAVASAALAPTVAMGWTLMARGLTRVARAAFLRSVRSRVLQL